MSDFSPPMPKVRSNELEYTLPRKIEIKKGTLTLKDEGIEELLERTATPSARLERQTCRGETLAEGFM